ncbi:hypothetical protein ACFVGM_08730 [Kitasatospora purpeofusca]|uniref:hypothetical protein n=1 Tax=Kitasatospora purpeofusca TaxID=67352 RepID=UPI0036BBCBAF
MTHYAARITVVSALQYDAGDSTNHSSIIQLLGAHRIAWMPDAMLGVRVGEQWVLAGHGDWVGCGADGEAQVWPRALFHRLFEPLTDLVRALHALTPADQGAPAPEEGL